MTNTPNPGDLKVWWIPQIPGKAFEFPVSSIAEGKKFLKVLADYDLFQYEQCVKPDYCNAGGLFRFETDNDGCPDAWYDFELEED